MTLSIDRNSNWRLYSHVIPRGAEVLGTVTRDGYDTGALVRFVATGLYAQVNGGVVRMVDQRQVARLLAEGAP